MLIAAFLQCSVSSLVAVLYAALPLHCFSQSDQDRPVRRRISEGCINCTCVRHCMYVHIHCKQIAAARCCQRCADMEGTTASKSCTPISLCTCRSMVICKDRVSVLLPACSILQLRASRYAKTELRGRF